MRKSPQFSPEIQERAVRMVFDVKDPYPSQWAAIESIAGKIGCTVRDTAQVGAPGRARQRPAPWADDGRAAAHQGARARGAPLPEPSLGSRPAGRHFDSNSAIPW